MSLSSFTTFITYQFFPQKHGEVQSSTLTIRATELKSPAYCAICGGEASDTIFLLCGHGPVCEDCEDANQWGEKSCTICQSPPPYTLLHSMVGSFWSDEVLEEVCDWIFEQVGRPESISPSGPLFPTGGRLKFSARRKPWSFIIGRILKRDTMKKLSSRVA